MNFTLFIANKIYHGGQRDRKVSKPAIYIATAGVAIGLAVMIISISIVLGFKHSIRDKVIGFGSHVTIKNFRTTKTGETYPIEITDSLQKALGRMAGIKHSQRFAYTQGLLKTDDDFLAVTLKGVAQDFDTTFIHQSMVEGSIPTFSDSKSQQKLLLSKTIADKLHLKIGEKIFAYFINQDGLRTRRFTIAGIYETNLKQFDSQICFTDLYTTNKLNGWQPQQYGGMEMQIKDWNSLDQTAFYVLKKMKGKVDHYGETYSVETITEQNPEIFSWLELMDLNVWIILCLMISVAAVTMISGLLIIILERTQMIGIMKALGAKNKQIRGIFLWFAAFIIGRGLLIGNAVALLLLIAQAQWGWVKLDPQIYYVSTVPIELNIPLIIAVNIATLLICLFVLIAPSYLISRIHPAKSMQYQ